MAPQPWTDILAGVLGGKADMKQPKAVKRAVKCAMEQADGASSEKRLKKELKAALASGSVAGFAVEGERIKKVPVIAAAPAAERNPKEKKRKREAPAAQPAAQPVATELAAAAGPSPPPEKKRRKKREKENAGQGGAAAPVPPAAPPAAAGAAAPSAGGAAAADPSDADDLAWRSSLRRTDVKSGAFSAAEKAAIRRGVEDFARANGHSTTDFSWILGPGGRGQKPASVKGLWKAVARLLPHRTIKSVAGAGNRMFHPDAKKGRWSPEEDAELRAEVAARGPQWQAIGARLGRDREACRLRWREIGLGDARAAGFWTVDEEQRLQIAVKDYLEARRAAEAEAAAAGQPDPGRSDRRVVLDDIDWGPISRRVGTRSPLQCLEKWYDQMAPSMVERGDWGPGDDRRLLRALWAAGPAAESDVDWGAAVGGRSAAQARRRWRLMVKAVPDARDKEFDEILDHLVTRFMPHLKEREAGAGGGDGGGGVG